MVLPAREMEASASAGMAERFRLFEAVTGFVARVAEPSGVLVVLDDRRWAGPALLRLPARTWPPARLRIDNDVAAFRATP